MKKFLKNIHDEAGHIRLTHAEKAAMKARIFGVAPTASPVQVTRSPYVFVWSATWTRALAAVMLFVIVGGGTASAAQGTLPGDLLYPIKVSITEKVEAAIAPTAVAKAGVQVKLAERRIEEAEALAAQGRLDATTSATLAANFDAHADAAHELADAADADEPGAGVEVKTRLASSLATHGAVLAKIGGESADESTKEESKVLSVRVIARAEGPARVAASARTFAATAPAPTQAKQAPSEDAEGEVTNQHSGGAEARTMALSATSDTAATSSVDLVAQKRAAKLQMQAADALAAAKKTFESLKVQVGTTTAEAVEKEFAAADTYMSAGAVSLGKGEYDDATERFMQVVGLSSKLQALFGAEAKFDNGILRTLLKGGE